MTRYKMDIDYNIEKALEKYMKENVKKKKGGKHESYNTNQKSKTNTKRLRLSD